MARLVGGERDVYVGGLPADMFSQATAWDEVETEWHEVEVPDE